MQEKVLTAKSLNQKKVWYQIQIQKKTDFILVSIQSPEDLQKYQNYRIKNNHLSSLNQMKVNQRSDGSFKSKQLIKVFANNHQYKAAIQDLFQYLPQQNGKPKISQFDSTNSNFIDLTSENSAQFLKNLRTAFKNVTFQKNILKLNSNVSIQLYKSEIDRSNSGNTKQQSNLLSYFRFQLNKLLYSKQMHKLNIFVVSDQSLKQISSGTPLHHKTYLQYFFNSISQTPKLWPYRFSLKSIQRLYNVFYSECNIRFQLTFDSEQKKIIKLVSHPLIKFHQKNGNYFLPIETNNKQKQKMMNIFQGRIFRILQNQSNQTKSFYKVPLKQMNNRSFEFEIKLQQIVQTFLSLGFKISQIKQFIFSFSAIMNLSQLIIEEYSFRIKNKQQKFVKIKEDETYLKLIQILKCDNHTFKSLILQSPNNQGLFNIQKQKATKNIKAIMRILWQSTLQYLSSQLNSKLTNSKSNSNNQKQKVISFACYNNSNFKDQFQMQEGSQLQIQYNNISRYIWNNIKKQSILFNKNIPVQKTKVQTIKNQKDLEKCIKKWHQYKIDQVYSLINIPFIQMQIQKQQIYEKIKKSTQCRHIIEKLLGNYDNSNYTKKLFLFFKDILKEEQLKSEKKIENHFLIKINCQKMLQETENNQVFEFIKNLVLKTTKHNSLNISQLKENNNNLSKQILIDKQFFKVQNQKTSSTQLQKKNLNLQNNLNCDHSYFSFPQSQITMDIEDFVNNYMYSSQLKVINKKFNTPAKQFKYQIQKQKLILALQKYLQKQQIKIQNFQCTLKSPSTLLISQQTFNNLQIQNLIITKFSKRLINQYRAYQYRNKFLKNLHNFHSRKLSFDKLQHFMITKKRQYFKHFKKRIGAKFLSNCIFNKQKKNFKYFIKKIKFNGISKVLCNTLMKITLNNSIFNKKIAFVKLKKKWKKIQSLKKILETLFKLQQIKDWKKQFLNQIQKPNKLYELTVTSPKGGKTNYHDLSIQINQVNKAVSHPGNTSTSNVKNSLSYGTKGFNKINLFPIEQEQSISSNEDQKKINSQKIQQRQNNQVNNEIKTKNNLNGSKVSDLSNSLVSQKSQIVQYLKKQQLCLIKDYPHFSFQGWYEDAINFKKSPLTQPSKPCQALFKKFESEKSSIIVQSEKQIQEDQTIKQRIAVHSFMNYLRQFVNLKNNTQKVQDIIKVQQKPLKQPILKAYPISSKPTLFSQIFNVILKLGLHKNTSKSFQQLLNLIIKPIKQIYNEEIMKANNLFNDEPLMTNSYTSEYNAIRDQMFLQFIKQIMGNDDIYSVKSLIKSLQIITRYIYPSNIFFYSFISYLKSSQIKRAQLYDPIYRNMLMFAQAAEGNKGTNVKIYKDQTAKRTQIQNSGYLFPRVTQLTKIQTEQVPANIKVKLPNGISFEYNVRNQIFKTIKRRILQKLGFSQYQKNYALYQSRGLNSFIIIQDKTKVIDYLMGERQKQSKKKYNQVYLRIKHYYPIKIRQINHLRMFYLNMITDEGRLPWKLDHYQNIVALSMLFDQFQQQRIGNYLGLAKKLTKNQPDLTKIQAKYSALANQGSKKISQFEYFKRMKQSNFLLAKCYKEQQQKKQYDEQIKIVIKPKQLLFYEGSEIKSSINLFRIKTVFFQNNQISIELIYSKQQRQGTNETQFIGEKRTLLIKGFYKIKELFQDILYYGQLLIK